MTSSPISTSPAWSPATGTTGRPPSHLTAVEDPSRFGVVSTDDDGRVGGLRGEAAPGPGPVQLDQRRDLRSRAEVLDRIASDRRVSIERETFPALVAEGRALYARAASLLARRRHALGLSPGPPRPPGRHPGRPPSPGAKAVADGVWVLGEPTLDGRGRGPAPSSATGPSWPTALGSAASVVGAGASSRRERSSRSVLLPGVRVGTRATVAGSILGPRPSVAEDCVWSPL